MKGIVNLKYLPNCREALSECIRHNAPLWVIQKWDIVFEN